MSYALFLDDERFTPENLVRDLPWVIARSFKEAMSLVREIDFPNHVAFDYHLGDGE